MYEIGLAQKRMEVLQQAKQEMTCRIAELSECKAIRTELQHRLLDLNSAITQLKAKQYELHQQNINVECERLQAIKQKQQCDEKIELGKHIAEQIQADIKQQKTQELQVKTTIDDALRQQKALQDRISQKQHLIVSTSQLLEEVESKIANLKKYQQAREQILVKIRQSAKYYTKKSLQIYQNIQETKKQIQNHSIIGLQHQSAIRKQQQKLQLTQNQRISVQRDISDSQQRLDSQRLKKKVLIEKLQILKQRLNQVSQEQIYSQNALEAKRRTAKDMQEARKTKISTWLTIRQRFGIQLQYASQYCQKLTY